MAITPATETMKTDSEVGHDEVTLANGTNLSATIFTSKEKLFLLGERLVGKVIIYSDGNTIDQKLKVGRQNVFPDAVVIDPGSGDTYVITDRFQDASHGTAYNNYWLHTFDSARGEKSVYDLGGTSYETDPPKILAGRIYDGEGSEDPIFVEFGPYSCVRAFNHIYALEYRPLLLLNPRAPSEGYKHLSNSSTQVSLQEREGQRFIQAQITPSEMAMLLQQDRFSGPNAARSFQREDLEHVANTSYELSRRKFHNLDTEWVECLTSTVGFFPVYIVGFDKNGVIHYAERKPPITSLETAI